MGERKSGKRAEPIRVSIVGVGAMGQRHARVFADLEASKGRFTLAGVFDVRRDAAIAVARARGGAVFESEGEATARADLVVFATPIQDHARAVEAALVANRHVLVEKPIAGRASEAQALVALAARVGRQLFVGHSERFNPVIRVLSRLLRGDAVLAIELRRAGKQAHVDKAMDWGALVNLGVHDFDLAAHLTGGPVELREAVGARATPGGGAEDLAHVLVASEAGAPGHIHVDRTAATKRRSVSILTQKWAYEGDLLAHRLTRTARATGARSDLPLPVDEPLVAQAQAIADALSAERSEVRAEVASGADGARALSLAERAAARVRAATSDAIDDANFG